LPRPEIRAEPRLVEESSRARPRGAAANRVMAKGLFTAMSVTERAAAIGDRACACDTGALLRAGSRESHAFAARIGQAGEASSRHSRPAAKIRCGVEMGRAVRKAG